MAVGRGGIRPNGLLRRGLIHGCGAVIVAALWWVTAVHDVDLIEQGIGISESIGDLRTVSALATSVSHLAILIGITMPHIQVLSTSLPKCLNHVSGSVSQPPYPSV